MPADPNSCFAHLDGDVLRLGNTLIERRWRVIDGLLVPLTLTAGGREWLQPHDKPGCVPPATPPAASRTTRLTVTRGRANPVEAPSLIAELACGDLAWRLQVFPDVAAITLQLLAWPAGAIRAAASTGTAASGIETDGATAAHDDSADLCERLALTCFHAHVHAVTLADQTDIRDNLAVERELRIATPEPLRLAGCVFAVEDPLARDGLVLLKHAPLPHARPLPNPVDLRTWHEQGRPAVALHGHGAAPGQPGYAWTVGVYRGGAAGRIALLHAIQRCHRAYEPARDGMLLSNTWGDRNRDGRICASFIEREIEAGGTLGVDVVQIDDGWQRGVSSNSVHSKDKGGVWQGFWAADAQFWDAHPERFPAGLAPTAAAVRRHGLAFGLWFAPDSARDFANWRRDADAVLGFWRQHGVTRVKIDGVKAHSKPGEANLQAFFAAVLAESAGAITFDLDVTAEIRPGYFGAMAVGPLFVENRYTDWQRWWPHVTLRNLWQLAHWIDPVRLRMEFLNRQRNTAKYAGDPLAPMVYPADWTFASVMVASPLAWFEVSELPAGDADALRPLIALWKRHRAALHGGTIWPVGEAPSGASCSGFCSLDADGRGGYLIALREPCAPDSATWQLPLTGAWTAEVLAGAGSVDFSQPATSGQRPATSGQQPATSGQQPAASSQQVATIHWTAAPGYVFVRLTRVG